MAYTRVNWQDGPSGGTPVSAANLNVMDAGIKAAHDVLDASSSAASANTLIRRDANGRAQVAAPSAPEDIARLAEVDAASGAAIGYVDSKFPVPVTSLKIGNGSNSGAEFDVQRYAFASPLYQNGVDHTRGFMIGRAAAGATARSWGRLFSLAEDMREDFGSFGLLTWDYLTASGHPQVWAEINEVGEIITMWEAEDPADPDFPDDPPIRVSRDADGEPIAGRRIVRLSPPDEGLLVAVMERLPVAPQGEWQLRSRLAKFERPEKIQRELFREQCLARGLEVPEDPRDVLAISDDDRRHWYLQLWLRQASRILCDHRATSLIPLYSRYLRVQGGSGRLVLK